MTEANKPEAEQPAGKDIWTVSGLEKRCHELIQSGQLRELGLTKFCEMINAEFSEKFAQDAFCLTESLLSARLPEFVWSAESLKSLKKAVRTGMSVDRFHHFWPNIPKELIEEKIKVLMGVSNSHESAKFLHGMGRLSTEALKPGWELFEFPEISFAKPYRVTEAAEWQVPVINGALVGIKYDRNIDENTPRRAFSDAAKRNATSIVLTNPLDLDTKKTGGPVKVYRAMASGLRTNSDRFPDDYRDDAKRIQEEQPDDELIYQTIAERFIEIMDGWYKITHRPDGSPEFNGPVIIVFGVKEEEVIMAAAYYECRYLTILKQKEIEAELGMANARLSEAQGDEDDEEIEYWDAEVKRLSDQRARTIITNIADTHYVHHARRMRKLVVDKFEEMIPNSKVISQGSTYLGMGDKVIEINIPSNLAVTDNHLANFGSTYGSKVFNDRLADLTVICHPYSLNHRLVGRDDSKDGQRVTKFVHVAPGAIDAEFLREELGDITKAAHPIAKAIFDPQYRPGVLLLSCANGIVSADSLPIAKLDRVANFEKGTNFAFPYPDVKYIWLFQHTDDHFGSRAKEHIWDPIKKMHFGTSEAIVEVMRREGIITLSGSDMPVHLISNNDDPTQGNHFETHKQPDPKEMSYIMIERLLRQWNADATRLIEMGKTDEAVALLDSIAKFNLSQFLIRGLDWQQSQVIEVFQRQIRPNLDFYNAVICRAVDSRLVFRGISDINGNPYDARDVGIINRGTGNHFERTVDRTLTEGFAYAEVLRALLGRYDRWREQEEFLEKAVRAPLYSNTYFAWGTVKAPGGYEWGLRFHSSPSRLSSWSDVLKAVIKNDIARGDDTYGLLKGRVVLTTYGDKHFYGAAQTPNIHYFMCAANTHTDLYGTLGFPPNNTGIGFVGLPVDGPDSGPILVRMVPYDYLRDWFARPTSFDWKKFLPNPV